MMRWTEACSAHMGDEKCIQNFGWKNLKGRRDHSEDLGIDGRTILK
jgi:hypothetical protein